MRKSPNTLRALGFDIFAGGFTLGVDRHFHVEAVLEESNYGVPTARHNMPHIPVYPGQETWPMEDLLKRPKFDFIYGNPPCAAWSPAGSKITETRDWTKDPRVNCTRLHFSLLERLRPRAWAWESVPQAFFVGRPFVDELTARALAMGYHVTYLLHNSEFLGVPQRRRRFFFVATDCRFDVLEPRWESINGDDAIRGLNDPGPPLEHNIRKYPGLLPTVKPGETLISAWHRAHPESERQFNARGHVVGRPCFTIKRMKIGEPAPVVMHEILHPTKHRGLSIKELAILCGYPPDYEFIGAKDAGQVGRGVCPPVGAWLARNVARCLKRNAREAPTVQVIDVREEPMRVTILPPPPPLEKEAMKRSAYDPAAAPPPAKPAPVRQTTPGDVQSAKKQGSGAFIRAHLLEGKLSDEQIVALVHETFPGSKTGKSDVTWNRGRLRKEGHVLPGARRASTPVAETNGSAVPWKEPVAKQPTMSKRKVPEREFDTTSLRANAHGHWVHRDYGAHFFRWGFAGRYVDGTTSVLDVGMGPDCMMIEVLTMPRNQVPQRYVGVDLNKEPRKHPTRQWAELHWEFNFLRDHKKIREQFDLVTNFEVIEHMQKSDGELLLAAMRDHLKPNGRLLLSTPVFSGKAAANHLHEWTIPEMEAAIKKAKLRVVQRFGTFAKQTNIKKVASKTELDILARLSQYYSGEVMSCFLAPLYPDAASNNMWVLQRT